jgi:hypothetical protein
MMLAQARNCWVSSAQLKHKSLREVETTAGHCVPEWQQRFTAFGFDWQ